MNGVEAVRAWEGARGNALRQAYLQRSRLLGRAPPENRKGRTRVLQSPKMGNVTCTCCTTRGGTPNIVGLAQICVRGGSTKAPRVCTHQIDCWWTGQQNEQPTVLTNLDGAT